MTSSSERNWQEVQDIFLAALERAPEERQEFLDAACDSPRLRAEVESLLEGEAQPGKLDELAKAVMNPLSDRQPAQAATVLPSLLPRYEIAQQLGSGGMGVVFKAVDKRLGRTVVLKFLPPHLSSDVVAKKRFLLEAQAAAALEHPNICTIYEIGEADDGKLYIVMGFYEGETIAQRIKRGALPARDAVSIALDVARGLAKAHERGIVHRDVKPANVILTNDGGVKILDFGIAKLKDTVLTQTGGVIGTFAYMSPEQAFGEPVDARTDIWSLGVVLYEMLTGSNPFRRENEQAMMYAVLTAEPEPVEGTAAEPLNEILRRALAKKRESRFATATEMAAALSDVLADLSGHTVTRAAQKGGSPSLDTDSTFARAGERRHATVVVSQLCGYYDIVERLPPEELDNLTSRIRDAVTEVAAAHGGILNGIAEEEIVTLFGVPVAHEDNFVRGVRAAVALHERIRTIAQRVRERWGMLLRIRTGIHSGVLVAQRLRTGDRRYRIAGPPVTLATRLASVAEEDAILVSQELQRVIAPFFLTDPGTPIMLQSGAAPTTPFRITGESGLQTRLEAAQTTGLTPFQGRERELDTLLRQLEQARNGNGQCIVILGDAGVGKSRLLFEFQRVVADTGVFIARGRSDATRTADPYLPFMEALRQLLRLPPEEGEADAEAAHRRAVTAIRKLGPGLDDYLPFLLHLLRIRSSEFPVPKHLQREDFHSAVSESLSAVLSLHAQQSPTALLLEDWHWADETSRNALRQIVSIAPGFPLLVLVSSRPILPPELPDGDNQITIQLGPVDAATARSLLKAVLKADRLAAELEQEVLTRAGGNPFFIEEICHSLVETGIVRRDSKAVTIVDPAGMAQLPDTVQAVVATRIDRLDAAARDVLKLASVIGIEFRRDVLDRTTPEGMDVSRALDRLKSAGLIQQTALVPRPVYRFKHVLTQEVAYNSLLEHQRAQLHAAAGRAIEELAGDGAADQSEILARHFSKASEWDKAIRYSVAAADRATLLNEYKRALENLDRAYGWLDHVDTAAERHDLQVDILFRTERISETLGLRERQQEIVDQLIELLEPRGDSLRLAEAYLRKGELFTLVRQFYLADQALEESLRIARALDHEVSVRNALRSLSFAKWHEGDNETARALVEQALEIDQKRGDSEAIEGDLSNLSQILKGAGKYDEALSHLVSALELSRERGDRIREQYILSVIGQVRRAMGDTDNALGAFRKADEIARAHKLPILRSFHLTSLANLLFELGETDESLELYGEAVELCRRAAYAPGLAQALRLFGEVLVTIGRDRDAIPHLAEAAALFEQLEDPETQAVILARLAAAAERLNRWDLAFDSWVAARALPRSTGGLKAELDAVEGMARTARRAGRPTDSVISLYREALDLSRDYSDSKRTGSLLNTLGILEFERGGYADAAKHYEEAAELFRGLEDPVHEGLMLNSLGVTMLRAGDTDTAERALSAAREVNRRSGQRLLEAHSLAGLGDLALIRGARHDARIAFECSLELRCQIGDRRGEGWMSYRLAQVHDQLGELRKAELLRQKAASIAAETSDAALTRALHA